MTNKIVTFTAIAALSFAPTLALAQSAAPGATTTPPAASPAVPDAASPQAPASEMPNTTGTAPSATPASPNTSAANTAADAAPKFVSAQASGQWMGSEIVGTEVVTASDEALGTISDVVIEGNGSVIAAVIDVGGFLGIGAKPVAVSFESLSAAPTPDGEKIVVGLTKEELNSAPEFKTLDQMRADAPAAAPATTKTN